MLFRADSVDTDQTADSHIPLSLHCSTVSRIFPHIVVEIKALTALVGRFSLSVDWEIVLNGDVRLFHLILNFL